jgi:hypothetical protein
MIYPGFSGRLSFEAHSLRSFAPQDDGLKAALASPFVIPGAAQREAVRC